jgi:hypothetical protein
VERYRTLFPEDRTVMDVERYLDAAPKP